MQGFLSSFKQAKNCVKACNTDGLYKKLEEQQTELEICEKALAEFKESKRRAFPRFYFVSSNDLLDILSNGAQSAASLVTGCACADPRGSAHSGAPGISQSPLRQAPRSHAVPKTFTCADGTLSEHARAVVSVVNHGRRAPCRQQPEARDDAPVQVLPSH